MDGNKWLMALTIVCMLADGHLGCKAEQGREEYQKKLMEEKRKRWEDLLRSAAATQD